MARNETTPEEMMHQAFDALDRWDDEGGATASIASAALPEWDNALAAEECQALRYLGAAVVMRWSDLATDVKRSLFNTAVAGGDADLVTDLPERIARFLHDRKSKGDVRP
jgi:hypothetical protein